MWGWKLTSPTTLNYSEASVDGILSKIVINLHRLILPRWIITAVEIHFPWKKTHRTWPSTMAHPKTPSRPPLLQSVESVPGSWAVFHFFSKKKMRTGCCRLWTLRKPWKVPHLPMWMTTDEWTIFFLRRLHQLLYFASSSLYVWNQPPGC